MKTTPITNLPPSTLAAVASLATKAAKANREALEPGDYEIEEIVTLSLAATVQVLADQSDVSTPQKARPWHIIHVLLEQVNTLLAAAGQAGLNLTQLVKMAEKVDEKLAKKAQKAAEKETQALKEPTRQDRKGKVTVKGEVALPDPTKGSEAA